MIKMNIIVFNKLIAPKTKKFYNLKNIFVLYLAHIVLKKLHINNLIIFVMINAKITKHIYFKMMNINAKIAKTVFIMKQ